MTETDWLTCSTPQTMLDFLATKVSERKQLLFACHCVRQLVHLLDGEVGQITSEYTPENCRQALEVAERFADGLASREELRSHADRLPLVMNENYSRGEFDWNWSGVFAVQSACVHVVHAGVDPQEPFRELISRAVRLSTTPHQCSWLRDIVGNPFHSVPFNLVWATPTVTALAEAIYAERTFDHLPILADALEEAGCTDADIITHCRQTAEHVRGCWVVDLVRSVD